MRFLHIAARVAVKKYAGPMLEMIEQSKDRDRATQAFDNYTKLWYERHNELGSNEELNALFPNKILQTVAQKATGKEYDDEQFPTEASADSSIHELDHVLADPSFGLNVTGPQSEKSPADSFVDEIIISKLWGTGSDEARNNKDIARGLYRIVDVGNAPLKQFFEALSKVHPKDKSRDVLFTRAIRDVREEFADQMEGPAGGRSEPHAAAVRVVDEIMSRADARKDMFTRELEEGFKRAYLLVQSMCANWTKKLRAIQ